MNNNKIPIGARIIASIQIFFGVVFLIILTTVIPNGEKISSELAKMGLSSDFLLGLMIVFISLFFIGGIGLLKKKKWGLLASIILFGYLIIINFAAALLDIKEIDYSVIILSIWALYYLNKKEIQKIFN